MPEFCPKCGKKLKIGAKFCSSCGKILKAQSSKTSRKQSDTKKAASSSSAGLISTKTTAAKPVSPARPVYQAAPSQPKKSGTGCRMGCVIGCLIIVIIVFLIIAVLISVGYYFLFVRESKTGGYFDIEDTPESQKVVKCGDSIACLDENLKKCARAKGETEIGDFAEVDFKILGKSNSSCVIFAEVTKIKDVPSQLEILPSFMLDKVLESFSMECLIPKKVYTQGLEDTGEYIADNMFDACRGKVIDMLKKFGVEEFEYE